MFVVHFKCTLNYKLDKQTSDDRAAWSQKYFINIHPAGDQQALAEALKMVNIKNKANPSEQINLPPSSPTLCTQRNFTRAAMPAENKLHRAAHTQTRGYSLFVFDSIAKLQRRFVLWAPRWLALIIKSALHADWPTDRSAAGRFSVYYNARVCIVRKYKIMHIHNRSVGVRRYQLWKGKKDEQQPRDRCPT